MIGAELMFDLSVTPSASWITFDELLDTHLQGECVGWLGTLLCEERPTPTSAARRYTSKP